MFTVKVHKDIIKHCQELVKQYNFGQRKLANGNPEQQLTGIIGQSVVMDLFGLGYVDAKSGFDAGVDIIFNNKKIDVKTMGRRTDVKPTYTNNFLKLQDYFDTDIYIFCSYHKLKFELTVCGWISKADFITKRNYFPKESTRTRSDNTAFKTFADLYEIDIKDLNQVKGSLDLKRQLLKLS